MRKVAPLLLLRLAALVAVFGSAVLTVDYQNAGDPAFCGLTSGCMAVRATKWSHVGAVPLPVIGLAAFSLVLLGTLAVRTKQHASTLAAVAAAGGMLALGFLGIQAFQIGVFCRWCVLVDVSAIVAAGAATWFDRELAPDAVLPFAWPRVALWLGGAALSSALPVVWGELPAVPPLPPGVAALAVPGKVTIVSFTDFECPYCRKLHPVLRELVAAAPDRLALVRKMTPLPFHEGARPAALAYLCTPEPRREEMADLLYQAPDGALTRGGTAAIAARLGLPAPAFAQCLDAPATQAELEADLALAASIHGGAARVPYTYIGPRVVPGFQPVRAQKAAQIMLAGGRPGLPVAGMLAAFGAVALAVAAASTRMERRA